MDASEWRAVVFQPCKRKFKNRDSPAYCLYCGKGGGPCTYANCPDKGDLPHRPRDHKADP